MTTTELPTEPGGYLWTDADGRNHLVSMHTNGYASGILLGQNAPDWGTAWHNEASELPAGVWLRIPDAETLIELTEKAAKWDAMQAVPPADMAGYPVDHATPRRRGMRELLETDDHDPGEFEAARRIIERERKRGLAVVLAPTGDGATLRDAYGQWPGDETDEQIAAALNEVTDNLTFPDWCDPNAETQVAEAGDPVVAAYREAIPVEGVPDWAEWVTTDLDSAVYFYAEEPHAEAGETEWMMAHGTAAWTEFSGRWCVDLADNWRDSLRRVSDVWQKGGGL